MTWCNYIQIYYIMCALPLNNTLYVHLFNCEGFVMALYFVSYDLLKTKDYQKIIDELKRYGARRMLESNWCFNRANSGESSILRDHFKKFIDSDDRLVVSEVTDWSGRWMLDNPNNL